MSLDISTLFLVATLICALLGVMLHYFGRQEKIPALNWWGNAYLLGAITVALWTILTPVFGEVITLAMASLGFIACGMMWNAARVFHGLKPNWPGLFLGAIAWLAAVTSLPPEQDALRMTIGAAIVAAYAGLTASQLAAERRKAMHRRWPTMVVPLLHGAVLMLPIVLADLWPSPHSGFAGNVWVVLFAVELVLYAIGTVFVIFMLVSERSVSLHKTAASLDPLTGMLNRRGFSEACARMIEREAIAGRPVSALIFDIDHFKSINDRFGHPAGDEVLKLFAAIVTNSLRISDLSGRIGGEEFAALLPCPIDEAVTAADRVREAFQNCGIEVDEAPVATTVSIGVAGGPAGVELEVLLAAADTALYQAKRGGRNRVVATVEQPVSLEESRRKAAQAREHQVVARGGEVGQAVA
ncbi:GGDEF domain-containing protein [Rhodopseudomonas sp. BR0G17]|uniref:GGDEF domain-containing protein n=1 Tax=Rhodopseudomonas sp. BR0G17 TaxID=2269368 RepID=UPI0013DEBA4C|nr:GGDEF domain-containing protein [Rhodopseudomonas sp. BR0G17]NEW95266.1 GGDEF domain-containing protein [Rhodopseudomonas sp. BR0G17]